MKTATTPEQCCKTCRHWHRDGEFTKPLDMGLCQVVRAKPFWLQRINVPTYPHEGTFCDEWSPR
jgi:hypothetical protein